jgi:signal peptidase I
VLRSKSQTLCIASVAGLALIGSSWIAKQRRRTRRYEIAERSMAPELLPGDYVIARKSGRSFLLGDVVIFTDPDRPGFELVKRVVGLPGVTVQLEAGHVVVDGDPVPEPWAEIDHDDHGTWKVGNDEIFVLGDQRTRSSRDSRAVGPIRVTAAEWTVRARYWPPARIGLI